MLTAPEAKVLSDKGQLAKKEKLINHVASCIEKATLVGEYYVGFSWERGVPTGLTDEIINYFKLLGYKFTSSEYYSNIIYWSDDDKL